MALFGCKKCGRSLEELQLWGQAKFCGDFWKCTSCDCDITKDLDIWFKEMNEMANAFAWDRPSEADFNGGVM